MYANEYGNIFIFFITSILGIFASIHLSMFLQNSKAINYIGVNCVGFYVWNFLTIKVLVNLVDKVFNYLNVNFNPAPEIMGFALSMIVLFFLVRITNRYVPFVYGKI